MDIASIGIYIAAFTLAGFNVYVFETGHKISQLVYDITNPEQKDKFNRRAKGIMIWAVINLPIPALTFFLALFNVSIEIFFEFNGIIIISSLILLIYFFKCLNKFKSIKKFPFISHLTTVYILLLAVFQFTFISSIIRGYSNEIYVIIALLMIFLIGVFMFIYFFYGLFRAMFTHKPEEDKKTEEEKRDWKEKINTQSH